MIAYHVQDVRWCIFFSKLMPNFVIFAFVWCFFDIFQLFTYNYYNTRPTVVWKRKIYQGKNNISKIYFYLLLMPIDQVESFHFISEYDVPFANVSQVICDNNKTSYFEHNYHYLILLQFTNTVTYDGQSNTTTIFRLYKILRNIFKLYFFHFRLRIVYKLIN